MCTNMRVRARVCVHYSILIITWYVLLARFVSLKIYEMCALFVGDKQNHADRDGRDPLRCSKGSNKVCWVGELKDE